jgi:hypothetical protein
MARTVEQLGQLAMHHLRDAQSYRNMINRAPYGCLDGSRLLDEMIRFHMSAHRHFASIINARRLRSVDGVSAPRNPASGRASAGRGAG